MSLCSKSTAIGAGIGSVGGAVLTGGSALGTVGGAAIGGVVVNRINKKVNSEIVSLVNGMN